MLTNPGYSSALSKLSILSMTPQSTSQQTPRNSKPYGGPNQACDPGQEGQCQREGGLPYGDSTLGVQGHMLYCITPALDRYLLHSDGTPCTQTMTSLNICSTVPYNTWHHLSHTSLFASNHLICLQLSDLLPSEPTTHHQLISTKLG